MRCVSVCLFTFCLLLAGCGSDTSSEAPPMSAAPAPVPMKSVLEQIAQTGEIGGSGMNFVDEMEKFKAADPTKAAKIEQELTALVKLTDPEAIKAKAKQLADGL